MITSTQNAKVKWIRGLQSRRRTREAEGLFVLEGLRLAGEVIAARVPVRSVFFTAELDARGRGLVHSLERLGAASEEVSPHVMAACSDTESPPGLLAVLPIPHPPEPQELTLAVIADNLTDPGNLGTLLRTSRAAGVQQVFLTGDTVDPYNPKVVRAAGGAHLVLPIVNLPLAEAPERLRGLEVRLADAHAGQPYTQADWRRPCVLVIGGEPRGPADSARRLASAAVHIPMAAGSESLNAAVAAAIILFEIVRQRGVP